MKGANSKKDKPRFNRMLTTVKVQNIKSIYLERVDIDQIAKSMEDLDDK